MPIRVLVVDDSAFMRRTISHALQEHPSIQVVGAAVNGLDALDQVEQHQPDVVTLDVEMPVMDGLTALRYIMDRHPTPVIMLSSLTQLGTETTIRALTNGAVDFVAKGPGRQEDGSWELGQELIRKVRIAALAHVGRIAFRGPRSGPDTGVLLGRPAIHLVTQPELRRVAVIGASTGGPRALSALVPRLPILPDVAYLIVQHMPATFTASLAQRLDSLSGLDVHEARTGDSLTGGAALVAPGGFHVSLDAGRKVVLDAGPKVHGVRPSVDVTLISVTRAFGNRIVAAILTGMGRDGAEGAMAARDAGGTVLVEDESSCVVFGMPRATIELGAASEILPLPDLAGAMARLLRTSPAGRLA